MQVTRLVNTFYTSNTYVLWRENCPYVWLVDCGDYASQVRPLLGSRYVRGVLLTHTHADHIYGLEEVLADFPDVSIYTNEFGCMALGDSRLNLSRYHTEVPCLELDGRDHVITVDEGADLELFEGVWCRVLSTPGHDRSCLSYLIGEYLFTGDSFIPGIKVKASFPNSNKVDAEASYKRLETISKDYTVCPGHGNCYDTMI